MLHGNKILHGNLRESSFLSFLGVVTCHLPLSVCAPKMVREDGRESYFLQVFLIACEM